MGRLLVEGIDGGGGRREVLPPRWMDDCTMYGALTMGTASLVGMGWCSAEDGTLHLQSVLGRKSPSLPTPQCESSDTLNGDNQAPLKACSDNP